MGLDEGGGGIGSTNITAPQWIRAWFCTVWSEVLQELLLSTASGVLKVSPHSNYLLVVHGGWQCPHWTVRLTPVYDRLSLFSTSPTTPTLRK